MCVCVCVMEDGGSGSERYLLLLLLLFDSLCVRVCACDRTKGHEADFVVTHESLRCSIPQVKHRRKRSYPPTQHTRDKHFYSPSLRSFALAPSSVDERVVIIGGGPAPNSQ